MEECLTLEELELIVKTAREKEERLMKFYAAFKGVNLDEEKGTRTGEEILEDARRRAEKRLSGKTDEEIAEEEEQEEFDSFGLEVETL